jgi:hypothetical protein
VDDRADREEGPRTPTPADLERIALSLNELGCRYAVIGGFAMQHCGFARPTQEIDLLIDPSPENVVKVCAALAILGDRASLEVGPQDVQAYSVVRIVDEIVIDLLGSACCVTFDEISGRLEFERVGQADVPYPRPEDLRRMKDSVRPKDAMDREFIDRLLEDPG